MFTLLDRASSLGQRRVTWKRDALNAVFRRVLRAYVIVRGKRRDGACHSLLAEAWPPRRAALLEWLDPAKFDAEGRARARLCRGGS